MNHLKERKYKLIQIIKQINDEKILAELESVLAANRQIPSFLEAISIPKKFRSIEEIKKEQNYQPIDKEEFFRQVRKLNIEEPIEDLLAMLTK